MMKRGILFSILAHLLLGLAVLVLFGMLVSAVMANDMSSAIFLVVLLLVGVIFLSF
jgi:hypothetical protein